MTKKYASKVCVVCSRKRPADEMKKVGQRFACNGWFDTCAAQALASQQPRVPEVICSVCGKTKPQNEMKNVGKQLACNGWLDICVATAQRAQDSLAAAELFSRIEQERTAEVQKYLAEFFHVSDGAREQFFTSVEGVVDPTLFLKNAAEYRVKIQALRRSADIDDPEILAAHDQRWKRMMNDFQKKKTKIFIGFGRTSGAKKEKQAFEEKFSELLVESYKVDVSRENTISNDVVVQLSVRNDEFFPNPAEMDAIAKELVANSDDGIVSESIEAEPVGVSPQGQTTFEPTIQEYELIKWSWLWTFLFGGFYFLYRRVWLHAVAWFFLVPVSWILYPFFARKIFKKHVMDLKKSGKESHPLVFSALICSYLKFLVYGYAFVVTLEVTSLLLNADGYYIKGGEFVDFSGAVVDSFFLWPLGALAVFWLFRFFARIFASALCDLNK